MWRSSRQPVVHQKSILSCSSTATAKQERYANSHLSPSPPNCNIWRPRQPNRPQNWLNKPDGGSGWASYFLSQGYECYIIDQAFRGRSLWVPADGTRQTFSAQNVQGRFTAPELYRTWPQAKLHTQWPGSGTVGDPVFDAYFASTVPSVEDDATQETAVREAGAHLLDRIGKPVILVGHSQGGPMVWATADTRPHLIHSIVALEPAGPPFHDTGAEDETARAYGLASVPLAYSPSAPDSTGFNVETVEPNSTDLVTCYTQAEDSSPRQLINLSKFPVLVVTAEASYHAQYDWCTVRFLRSAGVKTDHLELAKEGIHGNGHMMFLEKNSDDIAAAIEKWMHEH